MGKVKAWAMEMEDNANDALNEGAECVEDVIAHCKAHMKFVDENYIKKIYSGFIING